MLLRRSEGLTIAISQPRHAWLAGRLAEAWGGPDFEVPGPRESVICAATLHDIGWLEWERAPVLDRSSGLPLEFQKVPAEIHTGLWQSGIDHAAAYGALPALFVSRHGDAIYEKTFDASTARPEAVHAVETFRSGQSDFQSAAIERLSADPALAPSLTDAHLAFVKRFIVATDTMSLNLCWGLPGRVEIDDVPLSARQTTTLTLTPAPDGSVEVDPWPFRDPTVHVSIEGKRVDTHCHDQAGLDRLLEDAPPVTCHFELRAR